MIFYLKRFKYRLLSESWILLPALVIPLSYILLMYINPNTFTVKSSRKAPILSGEILIARTASPIGWITISELLKPASESKAFHTFLRQNFDARKILNLPRAGVTVSPDRSALLFQETMQNLSLSLGEYGARLSYTGQYPDGGKRLILHYTDTLFSRIAEGYRRKGDMESPYEETAALMPKEIISQPVRSLWNPLWIAPLIACFFSGLALAIAGIVTRELLDPSFKSERQIAEYTQVPLLGSLPDLREIPDDDEDGQGTHA